MSEQTGPPPTRREIFASWHQEPSLYREIYARTVATLIAAGVIYLIAVAAGYVSKKPAQVAIVTVVAAGVATLAYAWVAMFGEYLRNRDAATRKVHNERRIAVIRIAIRAVFSGVTIFLVPLILSAIYQLLK
ncbi:hypothetical protein [Nocardioides sp. HB32]